MDWLVHPSYCIFLCQRQLFSVFSRFHWWRTSHETNIATSINICSLIVESRMFLKFRSRKAYLILPATKSDSLFMKNCQAIAAVFLRMMHNRASVHIWSRCVIQMSRSLCLFDLELYGTLIMKHTKGRLWFKVRLAHSWIFHWSFMYNWISFYHSHSFSQHWSGPRQFVRSEVLTLTRNTLYLLESDKFFRSAR